MSEIDFEKLGAYFPASDVKWRPGSTNREKTSALALAYLTARAVMDRLDDVCGPGGWKDEYTNLEKGGMLCRLSLRINGEWVWKEDAAEATDIEPVKGAVSDALKRAAVKWGIGRYLYRFPAQWVDFEPSANGKGGRFTKPPQVPREFLPGQRVDTTTGEILQGARAPVTSRTAAAPPPSNDRPPNIEAGRVVVWNAFYDQCVAAKVSQRLMCEAFGFTPAGPDEARNWFAQDGPTALSQWLETNPDKSWQHLVARLMEQRDGAAEQAARTAETAGAR